MNNLNIVEKEFLNRAYKIKSNLILFDRNTAMQFVKRCEEVQLEILGIDAFKLVGEEQIQPQQDASINFGDYGDNLNFYDLAQNFLEKNSNEYVYEIISK